MLFLDGRNDLYFDVLRLLERHLASTALVTADLSIEDPDLLPYLSYIRDPANGYLSVEVPLDAGVYPGACGVRDAVRNAARPAREPLGGAPS
ncbi:MAG TPA: hypothetical protein VED41_06040 [Solirubrobacteraceae bacterium]|nr:hypothetical protein [Solirubrobacteraceae bacterium]